MGVYVQHAGSEDDIGLSIGGNIYWHDGHIDVPGQHWEEVEVYKNRRTWTRMERKYKAAPPLKEMSKKQKERAGRALFIYREAQKGNFYDLRSITDEVLVPL